MHRRGFIFVNQTHYSEINREVAKIGMADGVADCKIFQCHQK